MAGFTNRVTKLLKKVSEIKSVVSTYGRTIAGKVVSLFERVFPQKKREELPDPLPLMEAMVGTVEYYAEELEKAEQELVREEGEDKEALDKREEVIATCRDGVIRTKKSVEASYGPEYLESLGLAGETSEDPVVLSRMLKAAVATLKEKKDLPPPLEPEMPAWTFDGLLSRLQGLSRGLEESAEEVRREARETQEAQIRRRAAMRDLRTSVNAGNAFLESFARLVGEEEIADRIRPPGGRPPKKKETPSDPPPDNPT